MRDLPKGKKNKDLKANAVFIGSLDRSHDWKGLREILLAIKLYRDQTKEDIKLHVIGEGNNKANYQQLTKDYGISRNVKFYGEKFGKEKQDILRNATMGLIYPKSSNDAFPTVALEYWSHSLPIIASDMKPINKIFKNKRTAYLVKSNNSSSLAEAIKKLVTNKVFSKKISGGGYRELRRKYILENEIKKFYLLTKGFAV